MQQITDLIHILIRKLSLKSAAVILLSFNVFLQPVKTSLTPTLLDSFFDSFSAVQIFNQAQSSLLNLLNVMFKSIAVMHEKCQFHCGKLQNNFI